MLIKEYNGMGGKNIMFKLKKRHWDEKDLMALHEACWNIHFNLGNVLSKNNFYNFLIHEEMIAFAIVTAEICYIQGQKEEISQFIELFDKLEHIIVEKNNKRAVVNEWMVGYRDSWRLFTYKSIFDIESFCSELDFVRSRYLDAYNEQNYSFYIDEFTYSVLRCCGNKEKRLQLRSITAPVITRYLNAYNKYFSKLREKQENKLIHTVI